jgi:hypothetical protein
MVGHNITDTRHLSGSAGLDRENDKRLGQYDPAHFSFPDRNGYGLVLE